MAASFGLAGYWYTQFRSVCRDIPDMGALETQNSRQAAQIKSFEKSLAGLKRQMAELKEFNGRLRTLAQFEAPEGEESIFGVGGPDETAGGPGVRLTISSRERRLQALRRDLDRLTAEGEAQRTVQEELAKFLKERRSVLASTPSIWPVQGWVTSGFGRRLSPFTGKPQFHAGLDISTRTGTRVKAPADGVVTFAGQESGFGRLLVINHGHGMVTRYAHLHNFKVKVGEKVERGQMIAAVGNTGQSTGPHLHYEVLISGVPVNPKNYILD